MRRIAFVLVLGCFAAALAAEKKTVLIFGLTKGFRHGDAVDKGSPIMKGIAEGLGYEATVSEDVALLSPENVKKWNLIIFNNCTGTLFTEPAWRTAFMEHMKAGAGFMGFHSSTDCFYDWPEYGEMLNGWFSGHPWSQEVRSTVEDPDHPLMKPFGKGPFKIGDEIYQFRNYKRSDVRVLMSIDNSSVDVGRGGRKDRDYAICWIRPWGKGRVLYNAHGHGGNVFEDKAFQEHVKLAMQWAIGDIEVDTTPSKELDRTALAAKALGDLKAAQTDDERLAALGTLSWCPSKEALPLLVGLFEGSPQVAALAAEGAYATITETPDLPKDQQIGILKKALDLVTSRQTRKDIRAALGKLGVTDLPINVPPGYIAAWWVAGPIPDPNEELFEKGAPPETEVSVDDGFTFAGKAYAWKKVMTDDDGVVNLNEALGNSQKVVGYMYAEVKAEKDTPVEIQLGTDDGFMLLLNGEVVGAKKVSRGLNPGSDKFKTKLKAGVNKIVMKVTQGGGDWAGCLQIVAPKDAKLEFPAPLKK